MLCLCLSVSCLTLLSMAVFILSVDEKYRHTFYRKQTYLERLAWCIETKYPELLEKKNIKTLEKDYLTIIVGRPSCYWPKREMSQSKAIEILWKNWETDPPIGMSVEDIKELREGIPDEYLTDNAKSFKQ